MAPGVGANVLLVPADTSAALVAAATMVINFIMIVCVLFIYLVNKVGIVGRETIVVVIDDGLYCDVKL